MSGPPLNGPPKLQQQSSQEGMPPLHQVSPTFGSPPSPQSNYTGPPQLQLVHNMYCDAPPTLQTVNTQHDDRPPSLQAINSLYADRLHSLHSTDHAYNDSPPSLGTVNNTVPTLQSVSHTYMNAPVTNIQNTGMPPSFVSQAYNHGPPSLQQVNNLQNTGRVQSSHVNNDAPSSLQQVNNPYYISPLQSSHANDDALSTLQQVNNLQKTSPVQSVNHAYADAPPSLQQVNHLHNTGPAPALQSVNHLYGDTPLSPQALTAMPDVNGNAPPVLQTVTYPLPATGPPSLQPVSHLPESAQPSNNVDWFVRQLHASPPTIARRCLSTWWRHSDPLHGLDTLCAMFPELEPRLVWGALLARNLSLESTSSLLLEWTQDGDDDNTIVVDDDDNDLVNYLQSNERDTDSQYSAASGSDLSATSGSCGGSERGDEEEGSEGDWEQWPEDGVVRPTSSNSAFSQGNSRGVYMGKVVTDTYVTDSYADAVDTLSEFFSSIRKSDIEGVVMSVGGDMEKASAALLEWGSNNHNNSQDKSKPTTESPVMNSTKLKELHAASMPDVTAKNELALLSEFCPELASLYEMFPDSALHVIEQALCDSDLDVQKSAEYLILHPQGKASVQSVSTSAIWSKTTVGQRSTPAWTCVDDIARFLPILATNVHRQRAQQQRLLNGNSINKKQDTTMLQQFKQEQRQKQQRSQQQKQLQLQKQKQSQSQSHNYAKRALPKRATTSQSLIGMSEELSAHFPTLSSPAGPIHRTVSLSNPAATFDELISPGKRKILHEEVRPPSPAWANNDVAKAGGTDWEQYLGPRNTARTKQELELELKQKFIASRSNKTVEGIIPGTLAALKDGKTTTTKSLNALEVIEQLSIFESLFNAEQVASRQGKASHKQVLFRAEQKQMREHLRDLREAASEINQEMRVLVNSAVGLRFGNSTMVQSQHVARQAQAKRIQALRAHEQACWTVFVLNNIYLCRKLYAALVADKKMPKGPSKSVVGPRAPRRESVDENYTSPAYSSAATPVGGCGIGSGAARTSQDVVGDGAYQHGTYDQKRRYQLQMEQYQKQQQQCIQQQGVHQQEGYTPQQQQVQQLNGYAPQQPQQHQFKYSPQGLLVPPPPPPQAALVQPPPPRQYTPPPAPPSTNHLREPSQRTVYNAYKLDLHGLTVSEVQGMLWSLLVLLKERGALSVLVITGVGNHSGKAGPKLPAQVLGILQEMKEEGTVLTFHRLNNRGGFKVVLLRGWD